LRINKSAKCIRVVGANRTKKDSQFSRSDKSK